MPLRNYIVEYPDSKNRIIAIEIEARSILDVARKLCEKGIKSVTNVYVDLEIERAGLRGIEVQRKIDELWYAGRC